LQEIIKVRLFRINDEKLEEYQEESFGDEHIEKQLESWLENSPNTKWAGEKFLIINKGLTTNLSTFLDLLGIDREGNTAIIELKRGRTPREMLAQALEYASFVERLSYDQLDEALKKYTLDDVTTLSDAHKAFFGLEEGEAVSFNKDQRIVLVGQTLSQTIRQTSEFLRHKGLNVAYIEFKYFKTMNKEQLVSTETLVGEEPIRLETFATGTLPPTNRGKFLKSCDETGRVLFEALLRLADTNQLNIKWGSKGFSLRANIDSNEVVICQGYPPDVWFGQSLYTVFADVTKKVRDGSALVDVYRKKLVDTGVFVAAGQKHGDLKWAGSALAEETIEKVVHIFAEFASQVKKQGPSEFYTRESA
jgi:hypothetical protein